MKEKKKPRGIPPHWASPEAMAADWEEYKRVCDSSTTKRTEFSQRNGEFVTQEIPSPISYTIQGFCIWAKIDPSDYYKTYDCDTKPDKDGEIGAYCTICSHIRAECEQNTREKFEKSEIPHHLAPLWMSRFGYSTKQESSITGGVPVVISGDDELKD